MAMAAQSGDDDEISNIILPHGGCDFSFTCNLLWLRANFLKKESININLPKVQAADPNVAQSVQVAITRDGKLLLEGSIDYGRKIILNSAKRF